MPIIWSPEEIVSLLDKVRPREVLWNSTNPMYHKKIVKRNHLKEICKELKTEYQHLDGLTTDHVLQKFQYLRRHFQKQLKKVKTPSDSGAQSSTKWEFFNACLFMQPIYEDCNSESNFIHPDDSMDTPHEEEMVYEGLLEDILNTPEEVTAAPSPLPSSSTPSPVPQEIPQKPNELKKRKRGNSDMMEENLMECIKYMKQAWASQSEMQTKPHRYDVATEALISAMELLPPHEELRHELTVQVLSMVTETVRKFYDKQKIREVNNKNSALHTMPYKCVVPECKGNYESGEKVHVFSFPKEQGQLEKWLKAIKRDNFTPSRHSRVCELHFKPEDIRWKWSAFNEKTGTLLTTKLERPQLRKGAVPTQLPNCLSYLSASTFSRDSPDSRCVWLEESALENSIEEDNQYKKSSEFHTLEELRGTVEHRDMEEMNEEVFGLKREIEIKKEEEEYILDMESDIEIKEEDIIKEEVKEFSELEASVT